MTQDLTRQQGPEYVAEAARYLMRLVEDRLDRSLIREARSALSLP